MATKSTLRRADLKSDAWDRVKAYAEARIAELQVQNESLLLDESSTASTRGRISELRKLLALEGQPAEVHRTGDVFGQSSSGAPGALQPIAAIRDGSGDDAYPD